MVKENSFKQTEIGTLPEEWDIENIGNLTSKLIGGGTPSRIIKEYWNGKIPWMSVKDFTSFNPNFTQETITELGLENSATRIVPAGNLIIATRIALGKIVKYNVDVTINQDLKTINLVPKMNKDYFIYSYRNIEEKIVEKGSGSTVLGLSIGDLNSFKIPVPPLPEQHAIAEALNSADRWIESLEQLITKKRLIKQGAMQELLSPKEDWEVNDLGGMSIIYTGKKNSQDRVENGVYPFFVRSQTVERINSYSFDGEAILIPGEGNLGSIVHYVNGKFDFHQRVYKISDFNGLNGKYLYWYFTMYFGNHAVQNIVKATVDSIRLPTLQEFKINYPSIIEQTRIANILSDMDAEIDNLSTQVTKAGQLKKGMMQELLTGRTRLI